MVRVETSEPNGTRGLVALIASIGVASSGNLVAEACPRFGAAGHPEAALKKNRAEPRRKSPGEPQPPLSRDQELAV
jgi:hypothetical protein